MKSAVAGTTQERTGSQVTAGQSHEAMFECGRKRGTSAVREKCAAKMELLTAKELAVEISFRGSGFTGLAWVAQLVERVLGKDEVTGSIPVPGSRETRSASGLSGN